MNVCQAWFFVLVVFFFLDVNSSIAEGQENESLYRSVPHAKLGVDFLGNFRLKVVGSADIFIFAEQEFLRSDIVRSELELVKYQRDELAVFYEKLDSVRHGYAREFGPQALSEIQKKQIASYRQKVANDLKEILLPTQIERLNQLSQFNLLRSKGIRAYISWSSSSNNAGFDVRSVRRRFEELEVEMSELNTEKWEEYMKQVLSPLSEKQRDKVLSIANSVEVQKFRLEFLLLDLKNASDQDFRERESDDIIGKMSSSGGYYLRTDGTWERTDGQKSEEWFVLRNLAKVITDDPTVLPELVLTDAQLSDISTLIETFNQELLEVRQSFAAVSNATVDPNELARVKENTRAEELRLNQSFCRDFYRILPKQQIENLNERFSRIRILSFGLVSEIAAKNEWLVNELELDGDQIAEVLSNARSAAIQLEKELRAFEARAISSLLSATSVELNDVLKKALGEHPKYITPSPTMVLR